MAGKFDDLLASPPADDFSDLVAQDAQQPAKNKFTDLVAAPEEPGTDSSILAQMTTKELQDLAKKHGVSYDQLHKDAPFFGAMVSDQPLVGQAIDLAKGFLSEGLAIGAPQYIYKASQDEKYRAALDELQSTIQERKPLLQTAAEVIPGIVISGGIGAAVAKTGLKKLGAAATAGAIEQGLQSGLKSKEGEFVEEAAKGAAFGAGLGVAGSVAIEVVPKAYKALKGLLGKNSDDLVTKAIHVASDPQIATKLANAAEEFAEKDLQEFSSLQDPDTAKDFLSYLGLNNVKSNNALKIVKDKVKLEGPEFIGEQFQNFKNSERVIKELQDYSTASLQKESDWFDRATRFISGARSVARTVDDKLGTNIEVLIDEVAKKNNQYTVDLASNMRPLGESLTYVTKNNVDQSKLYKMLDGTEIPASEIEAEAFNKMRSFFDGARKHANDLGVPIAERKNYVPYRFKEPIELIMALKNQAKNLGIDFDTLNNKSFNSFRNTNEGKEFLSVLVQRSGLPEINTAADLTEAFSRTVTNRPKITRAFKEATAAYERGDVPIPLWAREQDVSKLAQGWLTQTLKHGHYRSALAKLEQQKQIAIKLGDLESARWLEKHLTQMSGALPEGSVRKAISERAQAARLKLAETAMELPEGSVAKVGLQFLVRSPDLLPTVLNNVYPTYLGLSPRALITNMMQIPTTTVPELGLGYGASVAARSSGSILADLPKAKEVMLSRGMRPAQWNTELSDALQAGLQKSGIERMGSKMSKKLNDTAMFLYERMEHGNRLTAYHLGQTVGDDLIQGNKNAVKFINTMSSGYRQTIQRALDKGNPQEAKDLISRYLVGKTVLDYNKATLSEFGSFMGPYLSVFTRFPSAVAADVIEQYKKKGLLKGSTTLGAKYMAPLLFLHGVDSLLESEAPDNPLSKVMGKGGLAGSAPIGALGSIVTGKIAAPPAAQLIAKPIQALVSGDPDIAMQWADDVFNLSQPFTAYLNLFTDVIPKLQGEDGTRFSLTRETGIREPKE